MTQANPYLLHLGLQCYDRHFLSEYCRMPATPLMVWARCPVLSRSHYYAAAALRAPRISNAIGVTKPTIIGALQLMEDLEQLKVLENGYKIKVITVDHCAHGVDEPHDVASIEAVIKELEAQTHR